MYVIQPILQVETHFSKDKLKTSFIVNSIIGIIYVKVFKNVFLKTSFYEMYF